LDSVSNLVDWVGLDFEKWTHGHLCVKVPRPSLALVAVGLYYLHKTVGNAN